MGRGNTFTNSNILKFIKDDFMAHDVAYLVNVLYAREKKLCILLCAFFYSCQLGQVT